LAFVFPTYRRTHWPKWRLRIGVKLYDWLCGGGNLGKSSVWSRSETIERLPNLRQEGLTGAVRYFDGQTSDVRLVIDTLRGASAAGATLANYVKLVDARREGDRWRCTVEDRLAERTFSFHARGIVNAAGPWADRLPHAKAKLRLTKGVHLVVDRRRLPLDDAAVVAAGRRILFAIPWGERVILGTTDTDYDGPPESPRCEPADQRYVLELIGAAFPGARLADDDVIATWAGLRPLVDEGAASPTDASREHEITLTEPGWWDVTGGKLTTYRLMGEQTIDRVAKFLNLRAPNSSTAKTPLLSGVQGDYPSSVEPPPFERETVEQLCREQWAVHLADVMTRRTSWRVYHADHARLAEQTARWMAELLGWNDDRVSEELAVYRDR
jgi:glycerol-3-phosphate dehydrogenase